MFREAFRIGRQDKKTLEKFQYLMKFFDKIVKFLFDGPQSWLISLGNTSLMWDNPFLLSFFTWTSFFRAWDHQKMLKVKKCCLICFFVCPTIGFVCLFVSLSICFFVYLLLCLFVPLSICFFVYLFLFLFVSLSVCSFVYPAIGFVCIFVS